VRVVETEEGRIDREAYAEAVADARLVCFSAITWTHGTRLPVADLVEIADEAGAFTLVDAVQSPGQVAMDVSAWGADAVAAAATSGCSARGEPGSSTSTARPRPSWRRARSATGASRIPTPTRSCSGGCEALRGRIDDPGRPRRADRGARRDRRGRDRDDRRPDRVAHGPAQRRRPRRPSAEPPRVRVRARHDRRRRPRGDGRPARRRGSSFVLSRTRTGSGRRSTPSPPRPRSTGSSSGSPSSGERSIGRVLVLRVQD